MTTVRGEGARTWGRPHDTRRGNLGALLAMVHRAPTTRSTLTRVSGLDRTSVHRLVEQLETARLVTSEPGAAGTGRGRPSLQVHPGDRPLVAAAEVHPGAVTVGLVRLGGRVVNQVKVPTDLQPDVDTVVDLVATEVPRLLAAVAGDVTLLGAAFAVPGVVDDPAGHVHTPHMGWSHVRLAEIASSRLQLPVAVENDARAAARAEYVFGAARDVRLFVHLFGGTTGVGGAVMIDGVPLRGAHGIAGEFGHMPLHLADGLSDPAEIGTLSTSLERSAHLDLRRAPEPFGDRLHDALLDDRSAPAQLDALRIREAIITALATVTIALDPECIVLGGSLSGLADLLAAELRMRVAQKVALLGQLEPDIRAGGAGRELLLIGAAEKAFAGLFADPLSEIARARDVRTAAS